LWANPGRATLNKQVLGRESCGPKGLSAPQVVIIEGVVAQLPLAGQSLCRGRRPGAVQLLPGVPVGCDELGEAARPRVATLFVGGEQRLHDAVLGRLPCYRERCSLLVPTCPTCRLPQIHHPGSHFPARFRAARKHFRSDSNSLLQAPSSTFFPRADTHAPYACAGMPHSPRAAAIRLPAAGTAPPPGGVARPGMI